MKKECIHLPVRKIAKKIIPKEVAFTNWAYFDTLAEKHYKQTAAGSFLDLHS